MQVFPEILQGVRVQPPYVRRYTPPFDEFEVDCCLVPAGELVILSSVPGPFVFVVITGEGKLQADSLSSDGKRAKEGDVFFVPGCQHTLRLSSLPVALSPCSCTGLG